ncbi:MAG: hypothetical protein V7L29_15920 [Nostoc sp.]|uniref:hypothetical protein n=1 Tax=Nostoc sp. TaxID=1180 RepID=UPI002FFA0A96
MSLQELKEQAYKLCVSDRLALVSAVIESLQDTPQLENWQYLVAVLILGVNNSTLKGVSYLPQLLGKT